MANIDVYTKCLVFPTETTLNEMLKALKDAGCVGIQGILADELGVKVLFTVEGKNPLWYDLEEK